MAKLYFRYGSVGSAKTLNLLAVAHNYRQQEKKVLLIKPKMDKRFGKDAIRSRAGLEKVADLLVEVDTKLDFELFKDCHCILCDEAQFLSPFVIDQFRSLTSSLGVPVICYGLRTDFKLNLFEGSKRLMEVADSIEEVKTTCHYCNRKSIMNLKHVNGKAVWDGPSIELGAEEKYFPTCHQCYQSKIDQAKLDQAKSLAGIT